MNPAEAAGILTTFEEIGEPIQPGTRSRMAASCVDNIPDLEVIANETK